MSSKGFAVLEASQFGKSSFVNLVSGRTLVSVGQNDGQSYTIHVSVLPFPDDLLMFQH